MLSNSVAITIHRPTEGGMGYTVTNRMDYSIPGCAPMPHDKDMMELQGYPRDWHLYDWDAIWLSQFPIGERGLPKPPHSPAGLWTDLELFNKGVRFLKQRAS